VKGDGEGKTSTTGPLKAGGVKLANSTVAPVKGEGEGKTSAKGTPKTGEDGAHGPRSPKNGNKFNFQDKIMNTLRGSKRGAGVELVERFNAQ
jgi:hypothetical protein